MAESSEPSIARILAYVMLDGMPGEPTIVERSFRLHLCGFGNAEIAQILGISSNAVGTYLHTARKKASASARSSTRKVSGKSTKSTTPSATKSSAGRE